MKRLYRILLGAYPAGFREEYGTELERQFSDEYRDTRSAIERVLLALRALADLAVTAPVETAREYAQDFRYAARSYGKRPVATAFTLVALALAIGVTTGTFSVLNALLIRSLPFRDPQALVEISRIPLSGPGRNVFNEWQKRSRYITDAATYGAQPMNVRIGQKSWRVTVAETTGNFLRTLGTEPELGRGFAPGEEMPEHNRVAVIGHGLWEQAFGGDVRALGATIMVNDTPLTVIGIAPRNFDFPEKASVWTPSVYGHLPAPYFIGHVIGRLKPGMGFDQASTLFHADVERMNAEQPEPLRGHDAQLYGLQDNLAGAARPASEALMGMMAFVLLIACANVAQLLLSRITERRGELAVRAALGASPARLTRQFITEATVLTATAALVGLAVAEWIARLGAAVQPAPLASRPYSVLDWRVIGFALGLAAITAVLFGVLPAWLMGRRQPRTASSPGKNLRGILIGVQTALTVTLAAGAFGMGQSFLKLINTDLGFRTGGVVTMSVSLITTDRTAPFSQQALERLRAVPGVQAAGATSYLPLAMPEIQEGTYYTLEGHPGEERGPRARVMVASPDYFRTMGIQLVEGREFNAGDRAGAAPVVIVTEEFARAHPREAQVGRKLFLHPARVNATIVGVVRPQRFQGPESIAWDVIFRPMDQYEQWAATFAARVQGDPDRYLSLLRDAVQVTDRSIPVFDVKTLDERLDDAVAKPRFYTTAIALLTGFAMLLVLIGAYGAASQSVSQRRHEIGIRIAVGGAPGRVRSMVFLQSMIPVLAGAAAGVLGAVRLGPLLKNLVDSAKIAGIGMAAGAAITIVTAAACAVWIGTSRVVGTDPGMSIRVE